MRKPIIGVALLAAIIFGAGYTIGQVKGVTLSSAAGSRQSGQQQAGLSRVFGTVAAINGDNLTITSALDRHDTQSSITNIVLAGTTQYSTRTPSGLSSATRSAIQVGSNVEAVGTLNADGKTLTASRVVILPAGVLMHGMRPDLGPHAAGQVTAVSGNTITIKPGTGRWDEQSTVTTVVVNGSTQYQSPSIGGAASSTSQGSVKVGSFILATGALSADGKTLTASKVVVSPNGLPMGRAGHFGGPGASGQVSAVNGDALTITPLAGGWRGPSTVTTVLLTGTTQYFTRSVGGAGPVSAAKSGITVKSFISARGTLSADGKTLTASRVEILPHAPTDAATGSAEVWPSA